MTIRKGVIELQQEEKTKNIFYFLRSKNTSIYEATLKSAVGAIELFHDRFDLIIDDLIEFYNSELTIINNASAVH